jgi:hypothetical protein
MNSGLKFKLFYKKNSNFYNQHLTPNSSLQIEYILNDTNKVEIIFDQTIIWSEDNLDWQNPEEIIRVFEKNFLEQTENKSEFKWGNKIPTEGTYICLDCGTMIEVGENCEYKVSDIFPVCPNSTCRSGSPTGTSNHTQDYWEKI